MRVRIERRRNSVMCNECNAFNGNPDNHIEYSYEVRIGNNTMSFCEKCYRAFSKMINEFHVERWDE